MAEMLQALSVILATAVALAAAVFYFERWRLARPGGPYTAADFSGIVLLVATAAGWLIWARSAEAAQIDKLFSVWTSGLIVFLVGAVTDQLKPVRGLRAFAAAGVAWWCLDRHGIAITTVKLPFSHEFVNLGGVGLVLSMVWLAVCGSVFARAGTIPRVSIGVGALTGLTFLAVAALQPQNAAGFAAVAAASLALVCLAQLPFTAYLTYGGATAGAYTLGVLLGAIAIAGALKNTAFLVALLPLLVISVPLFASTYSSIADYMRGERRGFWSRKHRHVHEILLQQGYSQTQTSSVLLLGAAIVCVVALILVWLIEVSFILKLIILVAGLAVALVIPYAALRLTRPARPPQPAETYDLLGVRIHRVTMPEAMERVAEFIRADTPHLIVTSDAAGIIRAQDDPEMRQIMNQADLVTADGAGVVLAARLLNLGIDTRVAGCDMVVEICRVAAEMGRSVYLLGAAPGVADKAAQKLQEQVPGLQIAGIRDGYFTPEQEPEIIAEIRELRPAALFVALGAPRQEKWIVAHMHELGVAVCIGVGGSFDVISGLKPRAPLWMQRCGMEWLYRSLKEPRRIARLGALPRILLLTFRELVKAPRVPKQEP